MFAYTYRAYWRDQGASDWNEIQSPSPITWTQEISDGIIPNGSFPGGQCPGVRYSLSYELRDRRSSSSRCDPWSEWVLRTNVIPSAVYYGPISEIQTIINVDTRFFGSNRSISFYFTFRNSNGAVNDAYLSLGGSTNRLFHTNCSPSYEYRNFRVTRVDGLPDNCGNSPNYPENSGPSCKTTFSTGLIVTRPECIEVTTAPPECPCCRELLPKASAILARLN